MKTKYSAAKQILFSVGLFSALLIMTSAITRGQETYQSGLIAEQRSITVVIEFSKGFLTVPDRNNSTQAAANPCWPFSVTVRSAPGSPSFSGSTLEATRHKNKDNFHTCTFETTGPIGVPLIVEPRVQNVNWIDPSPLMDPATVNGKRLRFFRGFWPANKPWTLGGKGVYLSFKFQMVMEEK